MGEPAAGRTSTYLKTAVSHNLKLQLHYLVIGYPRGRPSPLILANPLENPLEDRWEDPLEDPLENPLENMLENPLENSLVVVFASVS